MTTTPLIKPAAIGGTFESSDGGVPQSANHRNTTEEVSLHDFELEGRRADISFPHSQYMRHGIGIILLLITVLLWTVSNFLASTIFADNSYSKPYLVTYTNSTFFAWFLIWVGLRKVLPQNPIAKLLDRKPAETAYQQLGRHIQDESSNHECDADITYTLNSTTRPDQGDGDKVKLGTRETAWLSLEFCLLWFLANYFIAACLEYTSVASSTILASTSSIWTLAFGAFLRVENFSIRKLLGTLASLIGVILVSSIDLTKDSDENRGQFPHKSHRELAIGDAMALGSALLYGLYTILMKKRIGNEDRVDMCLFFGFVGLFNIFLLLPGFPILHAIDVEKFALPPTKRIFIIVVVNSVTSLISDFCWAYAMLLTSPLIVTVGLSLTIPLSLFGQMLVNNQTSGPTYWLGAAVVFVSFIFINFEGSAGDRLDQIPLADNQSFPQRMRAAIESVNTWLSG